MSEQTHAIEKTEPTCLTSGYDHIQMNCELRMTDGGQVMEECK